MHDYWKFIHPLWSLELCPEGSFEMAVKTFNYSLNLWMICGGALVVNAQYLVQLLPQATGELCSSVQDYVVRHAESGDPRTEQRPGAGRRSSVG